MADAVGLADRAEIDQRRDLAAAGTGPVRRGASCGGRMVSTAFPSTITAATMRTAAFDSTGGAAWRAWPVSCVV